MKVFFLLVFQLSFAFLCFSQNPSVLNYTEESGFNGDETFITDAQIDSEDFLWIVSINNLSRYDGERFFNYDLNGLPFSGLLRFKESHNQKYVVDISGKVFLIKEDSLIEYRNNNLLDSVFLREVYTDNYFDEQGNYHFSTPTLGYNIIQNDSLVKVKKINEIGVSGGTCILRENQIPFWYFLTNKKKEGKRRTFHLYNNKLELIDSVLVSTSKILYPLFAAKVGANYFFSDGVNNLIKFNNDSILEIINYDYLILRITTDRKGNLWVSTENGGVHFFKNGDLNLKKRKILYGGTSTILSSFDKEGGAWMFSAEKGLNYVPNIHSFYFQGGRDFQDNNPLTIYPFKDTLYVAGTNSITTVDLKDCRIINQTKPLEEDVDIIDFSFDKKNKRKWFTTRGDAYYKSKKSYQKLVVDYERFPFLKKQIFYLFPTESFNDNYSMIIGVQNNMIFVRDTVVTKVICNKNILGRVVYIEHVGDTIFLLTTKNLYSLIGDSLSNLSENLGIENDHIFKMEYFDNHILLSTNTKGVYFLKNKKLIPLKIQGIQVPQSSLLNQNDTALWFITDKYTFKINSLNDTSKVYSQLYEPFENIMKTSFNISDNGILRFKRHNGVEYFPFVEIESNQLETATISISNLKINDISAKRPFDNLKLNPNENLININYKSISFKQWFISYKYRLQGLDNKWRITREEQVQFTNLSPGKYNFEVKARKGLQDWSDSAKLCFVIARPIWSEWWFVLFFLLTISIIVYMLAVRRIKNINRENQLIIAKLSSEQRALRAKMSPHFIFNIITSAQYLILKGNKEKSIHFLQSFAQLLRGILDQSEKEYILLSDCISSLTDYLELERFRLGEQFDFTIEVNDNVNSDKEKTIPFMIQPFVENAIQHGIKDLEIKGSILVLFEIEGHYLKVTIEDNGIGRKASKRLKTKNKLLQQSHGIKIIRQRLKLHNNIKIGKDVKIEDLYNETNRPAGTKVIVLIKRI